MVNAPDRVGGSALAQASQLAHVVSPPQTQGYGANLNLGVRLLGDDVEFVLLANDDIVFGAEGLPQLVRCLATDPRAGVVGPRLMYPDGREATSFGNFPSVRGAIAAATVLPGPLWRRQLRRDVSEATPARVDFVLGAAMLVRRRTFDDVGGFDESFFLNWEEVDFCFRASEQGWTIGWCPDVEVVHVQGASISRELNFDSFYSSLRMYHRKRLGRVRGLLLEILLVTVFLLGAAYDAVAGTLRPPTAGRRFEQLRQRWRTRIFLRRGRPKAR